MRVYLDMVMVLNFVIDLFLLLATNRLCGCFNRWKGLLAASGLGGVYGGLCLLPGFGFLGSGFWRLVVWMLMGLLAFGWDRTALYRSGIFLLLSLALGGVATSLGNGKVWTLGLAAGLIWLLCTLGFDGRAGGRLLVPLEIPHGGKTLRLMALVDTGNRLKDPITGESVLVIDGMAAQELTGLTRRELERPLESLGKLPGARLVPYHSVGHSGFLLAMRFPDVGLNGRKCARVVAFAPRSIGSDEGYRALAGGVTG